MSKFGKKLAVSPVFAMCRIWVLHFVYSRVTGHRAKIMQKLNLKGVPELILYAVRKGIIS
jgi:hypothetical protein